jgi:hypothetical protein
MTDAYEALYTRLVDRHRSLRVCVA